MAWLVAGLGNPGPEYAASRHNAGFWVVDELADRAGVRLSRDRHGALSAAARLAGERVVLAEPQSYMNASGGPVQALLHYFRVPLDHLIVVHDDMDLPLGRLRVKRGGGHGGHNGLRSIHRAVGSGDYLRVKIGIGRPRAGRDATAHVLGRITEAEAEVLGEVVARAADAVETILREGVEAAMNRFNGALPAP
ncbi:MAG: aminoacyl-tRNA hydrolase [Nitrospirae bacterium]|nr:MAG: aminoacyl-tRNA hydrolase [Nitrospirota bacterium]